MARDAATGTANAHEPSEREFWNNYRKAIGVGLLRSTSSRRHRQRHHDTTMTKKTIASAFDMRHMAPGPSRSSRRIVVVSSLQDNDPAGKDGEAYREITSGTTGDFA